MTGTTPRPLRIIETDYGPIRVVDANGNRFCEIACAMALTAHDIVTAVNSHDELVKALEKIAAVTYGTEINNTDEENLNIISAHFFRHQAIARSALAKAKGEKT